MTEWRGGREGGRVREREREREGEREIKTRMKKPDNNSKINEYYTSERWTFSKHISFKHKHTCAHTHTQMHEYIWKFVNKDFHGRPEGNLLICLKTFSQPPVFPQSSLFPLRITTDRVCVRVWPCKCDHACVHAVCVFSTLLQSVTMRVCVQVCLCVFSITAKCDHAGVRASLSVCSHHYWKVWPRVCACQSVCFHHYWKVWPCMCACKSVCVFPALLQSALCSHQMQKLGCCIHFLHHHYHDYEPNYWPLPVKYI